MLADLDGQSLGELAGELPGASAVTADVTDAGPTVQIDRVLQMLLVHDIVEVDAGDVPIYDEANRAAIAAAEEHAARRLFGLCPSPMRPRIWRSGANSKTPKPTTRGSRAQ